MLRRTHAVICHTPSERGPGADCELGLTTVRLNPLTSPQMLGLPHIMTTLGTDIFSRFYLSFLLFGMRRFVLISRQVFFVHAAKIFSSWTV